MKILFNKDIRDLIKTNNLYHYQVADELGVSEATLVRWLRNELAKSKRKEIVKAIETLVARFAEMDVEQ